MLSFSFIGLALNFFGTVLLVFWPPPSEPIDRSGHHLIASPTFHKDEKREGEKRWYRHKIISRTALTFIAVGFLLQGIEILVA